MSTQVKPFFSVIIPTFNEGNYLPLLLQDLNNQTFQDFEILVVDGNSEDKTVTLAQKFSQTQVLISPKRNASYQRNLGSKHAKGEYLLFIDADSQLYPQTLQGLRAELQRKPLDLFSLNLNSG